MVPSEKRMEASASASDRPIAIRTWLGRGTPALHADPADAAMSCESSSKRTASLSVPGKVTLTIPGKCAPDAALMCAAGISRVMRLIKYSRSSLIAEARSFRWPIESRAAATKAMIAGALMVPLRISRSCPPPCSTGVTSKPRCKISAATPNGPPILWALIVADVKPRPAKSKGTFPKLCTASECTGISPAIATTSAMGWIVPSSLLECITAISAIRSRFAATKFRRNSMSITPASVTGINTCSAPSCSTNHSMGSKTA